MRHHNILKLFIIIFAAIIFAQCANIVAPSGGEKDVSPPMPVKVEPSSNTVNFNRTSFRIWFDEFIKLKDVSNQVIVSPPMNEMPELTVRGKSLVLKFKDSLKDNTTYNISFGNSIIDITESNPLLNLRYVLSTGNHIDSMKITGYVADAYSLAPMPNVFVMLYKHDTDSLPLQSLPDFVAKTGEDGRFYLSNLPVGKFKVFALKDGNSNYLYDLPTEKLAFSDTLVKSQFALSALKQDTLNIDSTAFTKTINNETALFMFSEVDSTQKLLRYNSIGIGLLRFAFRFPAKDFKFIPINPKWDEKSYIIEQVRKGDTIQIWFSDVEADSLEAIIMCEGKNADTINMALTTEKTSKKMGKGAVEIEKLNISFSALPSKPQDLNQPLRIYFSRPIVKSYFDKVFLTEGDDTLGVVFAFADSSKKILKLSYEWEEEKEYQLHVLPSAFVDIQDFYNDSLKTTFKSKSIQDYGKLHLKIETLTDTGQLIIYLINSYNEIIKEFNVTKTQSFTFDFLQPGNYKMRAVFDNNVNGRWDTGDYFKKIQPEKVSIYLQSVIIKAAWETEMEWTPQ